jgi:hypothetical protein
MANNTFPVDWRDQPCFLIATPRPLVPYVTGLLKILESPGFWQSEADYIRGYTAAIEWEECAMTTCLDVLLEKQDAMYRLLDTALRGTAYTVVSEDPLVVEPAIEPIVELGFVDQLSLMGQVDQLTQLLDNRLAETDTPLYSDLPGIKQQLEDIIAALAEPVDLSSVISELEAIALLLA